MFSLKRVVQWKTAQKDRFEKRQRSLAIDRSLKRDWDLRGRNEYNILLLGADHKGKKEIMQFARRFPEDTYTTGELAGYRLTIYRILIDSVKALVGAMDEFGIVPDSEESKSYCAYLKSSAFPPVDPQKPLEPKVGEAIAALRTDTCIAQVMEHSNAIKLSEDAMHFINSVQRIASPNYLPTPADVCRTRIGESLLSRYSFRNLSVRLFDSGSATRRSRKWEDCFETTVQIAIFVVDLACYDEPLFDDNSLTRMTATLALFKRTVEARWAERMMFVLVMNNLLDFQEKLEQSPLVENFPDYAGGNDSKSACVYLTELFRGLDAREGPDRVHGSQLEELGRPTSKVEKP
ncbi:hypothetical protein BU16DRAFT_552078 [Lophium mytilinum]|uniref:Guanine nucleotide binding protein, alpha subunit n=1 Tax=Lophium mytilinum TaxID=390894 RepID=A0A6A6QK61_9PEZI|nr:hypothetical protein BU16DRAFT_552078 [Lophium mytilinum]